MKLLYTILSCTLSFTSIAQNWSELTKVVSSDGATTDWFGYSVSMSSNRDLVGAYKTDEYTGAVAAKIDAGSAYVFEISGSAWMETAKLVASDREPVERFGVSVCINGDDVLVGAYLEGYIPQPGEPPGGQIGAAYIYKHSYPVGMINSDINSGFKVYPNPMKKDITIDLQHQYKTVIIKITDLTGKVLHREQHNNLQELKLYLNEPAGMYLLQVYAPIN